MKQAIGLAPLVALCLSSVAQAYVVRMHDPERGPKHIEVPNSNLTAEEYLRSKGPVVYNKVERRAPQAGTCGFYQSYSYDIIGDGNPHQNFKIAEVKNTKISCPGSTSEGVSHTFGWSIGGGFNPGSEAYDFASLSFSVSESDTQSVTRTFSCDAGTDMTDVCVMHYTAVTAVSVTFKETDSYSGGFGVTCPEPDTKDLGTGVVYLPNANSVGSTIGRGVSYNDRNIIQCRGGDVDREVDFYCGPKGGPEFWTTAGDSPWSAQYMANLDPPGCTVPIEALKLGNN